jgi:hypothetical protein
LISGRYIGNNVLWMLYELLEKAKALLPILEKKFRNK